MNRYRNVVDLDQERRRYAPKPKPLGKRELRKFLDGCTRDELVEQVLHLFAEHEQVREYYDLRVRPEAGDAITRTKYKKIIENEFQPLNGLPKLRLQVAKKAVSDYRKVAPSTEAAADVMLYYVEMGVAFLNEYGDVDQGSFYASMERMCADALAFAAKHGVKDQFAARCRKLVRASRHFSFYFFDAMLDLHNRYFDEDPFEES
jgi:Family of unknown function (DUF6155)